MNCNSKIKFSCGTRTPSTCVFYDIEIPEFSNLKTEQCVTIEETTEDLYKLIASLRESTDMTLFEKKCLDIDKKQDSYTEENVFLIKDVIQALQDKVCNPEESSDHDNIEFILQNLDYNCLVLPCDTKPKNLFQFFQLLIDKICNA